MAEPCFRESASTCDGQPICYTRVAAAPLSSRSAGRDADDNMHTNSDSVSPVVTAPAWQESPAVEVDDSWLSSSDQDRSIRRDLREIFYDELWPYRGLLYELTRRDIRVRYKQTALGFAWAVLLPSLIVLAGAMVRYAMAYVGGRHLGAEDLAGIAIKAVPWSFFVGSMGFATASLVGQANLVTKIYFPREVLPLAATLAQAFDACLGVVVAADRVRRSGRRLRAGGVMGTRPRRCARSS